MRYTKYLKYILAFFFGTTLVMVVQLRSKHKNIPMFMQNAYDSMMNRHMFRSGKTAVTNSTGENRTLSLKNQTNVIFVNNSARIEKITTITTIKTTTTTKKAQSTKAKKRPRCRNDSVLPKFKVFDGKDPNVTVVTAYFNIGKFKKGGSGTFDTPLYTKWANVFRNMQNPVIFYTDNENFGRTFAKVRSKYVKTTKIIHVNKTDLWAFRWVEKIRSIYSIKGYPKYHPNTVVPEYSCIQHAKHAVVEDAILKNYSTTRYITWIDVGYFRYVEKREKKFWIVKPRNFIESRIAMNEVYKKQLNVKPATVIKSNMVWIGGGMAFAISKVYLDFAKDYRRAVERYLSLSLMNTDQQIIYAMSLPEERNILKPKVDIQIYVPDIEINCWFYLGYSCYRELP